MKQEILAATFLSAGMAAAPSAHAQATVCVGNVCETGGSSVSIGPTTVHSSGSGTYINGRRVDPANPRPLSNPDWQRPQVRIEPHYQDNSDPLYSAPGIPVNMPAAKPVVCPVSGSFEAAFPDGRQRVTFGSIEFPSVDAFQDTKTKLWQKGLLGQQYVSATSCGPVAVAAIREALRQDPQIVLVEKNSLTGLVSVGFNF